MYVVIRPESVEDWVICNEESLSTLRTGCVVMKLDPGLIDDRGKPIIGVKEIDSIVWD